jgi:hypothetical protein
MQRTELFEQGGKGHLERGANPDLLIDGQH